MKNFPRLRHFYKLCEFFHFFIYKLFLLFQIIAMPVQRSRMNRTKNKILRINLTMIMVIRDQEPHQLANPPLILQASLYRRPQNLPSNPALNLLPFLSRKTKLPIAEVPWPQLHPSEPSKKGQVGKRLISCSSS